jgi:hypothetical protein
MKNRKRKKGEEKTRKRWEGEDRRADGKKK